MKNMKIRSSICTYQIELISCDLTRFFFKLLNGLNFPCGAQNGPRIAISAESVSHPSVAVAFTE